MRTEVVGQREYGVFVPKDRRISLTTLGMSSCFAFSLQENRRRYGFLAHVDIEEDLIDVVKATILTLDLPSSVSIILETANLYNTNQAQQINRSRIIDQISSMLADDCALHLKSKPKDLGFVSGITIAREMEPITFGLFTPPKHITQEQMQRLVKRTKAIRSLYDKQPKKFMNDPSYRPKFRCAYQSTK